MIPADRRPVEAIGWATVELDRAASVFAPLLATGATFAVAPDCRHLGATCRVGRLAPDAGARFELPASEARFLVLLEPTTEGRLALTLARNGESWCATWTRQVAGVPGETGASDGDDDPVSALRDGPFGPERIVLAGSIAGPHRLLVEAATIEP